MDLVEAVGADFNEDMLDTMGLSEAAAEEFYDLFGEEVPPKPACEDALLLEAMLDVEQGSAMEAEEVVFPSEGRQGLSSFADSIPHKFVKVAFDEGKLVNDGYKVSRQVQTYDYLCELSEVGPGDQVAVPAGDKVKVGKVISVFTKSFREMPLPAHRYKKVVSKCDRAKIARPAKCYAMVQFPDRGKAYTYVCDLPEVKVGDCVRVKAQGKEKTVKVLEFVYSSEVLARKKVLRLAGIAESQGWLFGDPYEYPRDYKLASEEEEDEEEEPEEKEEAFEQEIAEIASADYEPELEEVSSESTSDIDDYEDYKYSLWKRESREDKERRENGGPTLYELCTDPRFMWHPMSVYYDDTDPMNMTDEEFREYEARQACEDEW